MDESQLGEFKFKLGFGKAFSNIVSKIWLFCGDDVSCTLIQNKQQLVTCKSRCDAVEQEFILYVIYAKCTKVERRELWNELKDVDGSFPWITGGDFNIVRASTGRLGGIVVDMTAIGELNECIADCALMDVAISGSKYT